MTDSTRVMAVGTVMVDVLAVGIPHVAEPGHVVYTPNQIEALIGGHPIDVAIDLAEMGIPAPSIGLVAAIGEGIYGSYVDEVIDRYGFETHLQRVASRDTGTNIVLEVAGEDRRFHIDPGANWDLSPRFVAEAIAGFAPQILTIRPGYTGIDRHVAELLEPLDETLVLLDVMQPHPSRPVDLVIPALQYVDLVHCNQREALTVTGAADLDEAVRVFFEHGVGMVLVTSGEHGASVITPSQVISQQGFEVDAVDATGCGDAFCAGIIEFLIRSESPPTRATLDGMGSQDQAMMLARGQTVGASAATKPGCVEGVSKQTVDAIWSHQGESVLESTDISGR
jgi:sugar/nucleoside kinase (ribokinase family)